MVPIAILLYTAPLLFDLSTLICNWHRKYISLLVLLIILEVFLINSLQWFSSVSQYISFIYFLSSNKEFIIKASSLFLNSNPIPLLSNVYTQTKLSFNFWNCISTCTGISKITSSLFFLLFNSFSLYIINLNTFSFGSCHIFINIFLFCLKYSSVVFNVSHDFVSVFKLYIFFIEKPLSIIFSWYIGEFIKL